MKRSFIITCLLGLLCLCYPLSGQDRDTLKFKDLEPYDFHLKWLNEEKALLLDVREPFEFRKNRIKDAINAPSAAILASITDTLDKDTYLFLYCSTGYRSKKAAAGRNSAGFINVVNLRGGIVAWKKDGYPIEKRRRTTKD